MELQRGLTIHFMDGTKLRLDFPKQAATDAAAAIKFKEIMAARYLVAEIEGALVTIPFDNVKYLSVQPAPAALPEFVIKAAKISER